MFARIACHWAKDCYFLKKISHKWASSCSELIGNSNLGSNDSGENGVSSVVMPNNVHCDVGSKHRHLGDIAYRGQIVCVFT